MAEGQKEAWGGDKMKIILFKPAPRHQNIKCHIMCSTLLHYISDPGCEMINTKTQRTIQRSSSWAINYIVCECAGRGDNIS